MHVKGRSWGSHCFHMGLFKGSFWGNCTRTHIGLSIGLLPGSNWAHIGQCNGFSAGNCVCFTIYPNAG